MQLQDATAGMQQPKPGRRCRCRLGWFGLAFLTFTFSVGVRFTAADDLLILDNGTLRAGIDRDKGAAITWLSWKQYPRNIVNAADPGRLIQQSYYAGKSLDRTAAGQSRSWSPWVWNPIQGGGIGSWARVTDCKRLGDHVLYAETIPKLWDMPNEEAAGSMRQWTALEPSMSDVLVVRCEFVSRREADDAWGPAVPRHQEIPACYFTGNFSRAQSYLGDGQWRRETQPPGPPWGRTLPPHNAMAFFEAGGQGIGVYSPAATQAWNFGPHGADRTDDPSAGPCMHVAPLDTAALAPDSVYRYRYWLIVGDEATIAARLESLMPKYSGERTELTNHPSR